MLRKSFDGEVYYWWDDGKPYPRARKAKASDEKPPEHKDDTEAVANSVPKDSEGEGKFDE